MGFISSMLGGQSGFKANTINPNQQQDYLNQANQGVGQQQSFVNALQPGGAQGLAAQQQLLSMLQSQAAGGGPNPALDQLNNATAQNIQQQAALQGSQRGVGQNAGMLARQVGQQGANIQQQAVGQAALQRAQQTLAAQQMLGQQANQQVGQQQEGLGQLNAAQQGLSGQVFGALGQQNAVNSGTGVENAKTAQAASQPVFSGIANALGSAVGFARGGEVPSMSVAGQFLSNPMPMNKGGRVPVVLSPGELKVDPHDKTISKVPGKASVKGDSLKNDTVHDAVKPGTVIVPRTKASDPKKAAAFVAAVAAKRGKK